MMVRRRLTGKRSASAAFNDPLPAAGQPSAQPAGTSAQAATGQPSANPAGDSAQAAPQPKFRACYSFNYSHSGQPGRRQPSSFTREELGLLVAQRHADHFAQRQRPGLPANRVVKYVVFRELHADRNVHMYGMILCERPYHTTDIQKALREKDTVYLSFGAEHMFFWTGVKYGAVPTVHKAAEEIDKQPYHSQGKTIREELVDMPKGARVSDKEQVRAFLGLAGPPRLHGRSDRLGDAELALVIKDHAIKERSELLNFARQQKESMPLFYSTVLKLGAKRADDFLQWVWELEGDLAEPCADRIQKLLSCSLNTPCNCGGRWIPAADELLQHQGIDKRSFCMAVLRALRLGRHKETNVLIVGEPDAGKSFIFKPLGKIFKTFIRRGQNDTFSLQGIHGNDICLLQDVRYETFGLPWDDWLAWAEGEDITVRLPRNHFSESKQYSGTAPLFATMCDIFSYPACEARRTGRSIEKENRQFRSRWQVVHYRYEIPQESRDPTLHPCACCCAQWYAQAAPAEASDYAANLHRPVVRVLPSTAAGQGIHQTLLPQAQPTAAGTLAQNGHGDLWERLQKLMQWRAAGQLSDLEFSNAKRLLGLQ